MMPQSQTSAPSMCHRLVSSLNIIYENEERRAFLIFPASGFLFLLANFVDFSPSQSLIPLYCFGCLDNMGS